jgi:hypothetical protein
MQRRIMQHQQTGLPGNEWQHVDMVSIVAHLINMQSRSERCGAAAIFGRLQHKDTCRCFGPERAIVHHNGTIGHAGERSEQFPTVISDAILSRWQRRKHDNVGKSGHN